VVADYYYEITVMQFFSLESIFFMRFRSSSWILLTVFFRMALVLCTWPHKRTMSLSSSSFWLMEPVHRLPQRSVHRDQWKQICIYTYLCLLKKS